MTLSDFIKNNLEAIIDDWQEFAHTLTPAAQSLDRKALRDFAKPMLERVAEDMAELQSREEQAEKSRGEQSEGSPGSEGAAGLSSAAHIHAQQRLTDSFTQDQLLAEFRALRAYVTRRWREQLTSIGASEIDELIRFNEAIDELLTESLAHYGVQLREVRDELSAAREREEHLRALDLEKDKFLSMLAHELRNPLATILNAAHTLNITDRGHDEPTLRAVTILERQTRQMSHLVNDLLDTARISSGHVQLHREMLDMARVVQQSVEDMRPQIEGRGLALELSLPPEPLYVDADAHRLAQVIGNLLDNAAKFTPEGGQVTVELQAAGDEALLQVTDTGIGISAERLPQVFRLFEQGEVNLDRTGGGLGLGLYLVRELVEGHGGRVSAYSEGRDRGSRFDVRLPLAQAKSRGSERAESSPAQARRRRVMVVDDNADAAESLQMLLQVLGHEARTAAGGREALAMAEEFLPEVVLLDLGLPGMDGFEVARELSSRFGSSMRLVAVTGYGEESYRRAAMQAGFSAHIVKPPSRDAIVQAIADGP